MRGPPKHSPGQYNRRPVGWPAPTSALFAPSWRRGLHHEQNMYIGSDIKVAARICPPLSNILRLRPRVMEVRRAAPEMGLVCQLEIRSEAAEVPMFGNGKPLFL